MLLLQDAATDDMMRRSCIALLLSTRINAFATPKRRLTTPTRLSYQLADKEKYLAEKEFDPVSLRQWRRETLIRYSNANQSEPLRILLTFLLGLSLIGAPALADAIGAPAPEPLPAYVAAGLGSWALFARERGSRTKRLAKIERECDVAELEVAIRPAAAAVFPGLSSRASLRSLRNSARVVGALCPDAASLAAVNRDAKGLRRRLAASRCVVAAVGGDGSVDATASCAPGKPSDWTAAFKGLLTTDDAWGDFDFESKTAAYFALSFKGRSVGSGLGAPDLVELLGSLYPPRDIVAPTPPLAGGTPLLDAQRRFYGALRSGDLDAMRGLFSDAEAAAVTAGLDAGARVDPWESQLRDDARPKDLEVGDADETTHDDGSATTTAIEATGNGQTLLAVQRWVDVGGDWKLVSHSTIPFATNTQAGAVLKCDCRGCIALVRGQQAQLRE